ncbi:uncharacterized protein [Palaemon carinicauda]|uniref:uncharacterized protein n=1 Tax=Palaemon carinicauda TaxID=392227 RepID=UPI0035B598BF
MARKMEGEVETEDLYDNLLSAMDNQSSQMQQVCEQLIDMKREISSLSNALPVTSTPFNSNRADTSDINPFVTVDRADITPTSVLTHNLPISTQPVGPNDPVQGSNTINNPVIRVGNVHDPIGNQSKGFCLKPKDILMLKLSDLQGIGTDNRLARFFCQVEFCVSADMDRIQVALTRVDQEIATLITAEMAKRGNTISWSQIKDFLNHQFACSVNITQSWQEIEMERYSVDEAPRTFVNRMKCKLSAFALKFPKDTLPKADNLVKRKLYSGLDGRSQERLVDFLDDGIPLERFIELFEYEYHLAIISGTVTQRRVLPVHNSNSLPKPAVNSSAQTTSKLEDLEKQISELSNQLKRLGKKKGNNQYCAYCKVRDHKLSECPHNPPRGVCFDCHRPGCKRGSAQCPGPVRNE